MQQAAKYIGTNKCLLKKQENQLETKQKVGRPQQTKKQAKKAKTAATAPAGRQRALR
ncbi:MAG: hypothetical protein ABJQ38_10510 [Flavobacteriaceae bacterium]